MLFLKTGLRIWQLMPTPFKSILSSSAVPIPLWPKRKLNPQTTLAGRRPAARYSSAKNAHLISLHGEEDVLYLPNAYAYSVDDVLKSRQLSKNMPDELSAMISYFDRQINAGKLEEAKHTLHIMAEQFGCNNPSVVEAQATFDLETIVADL